VPVSALCVLPSADRENFGTVVTWPATHHGPDGTHDEADVALLEETKPQRGPDREHMIAALEDLPAGRNRPITVQELPSLLRLLYAASFTVVCFLSGMRPGEVLNLRGCRDVDPETGELIITGRRGKGFDRGPLTPGTVEDRRPWVVVEPVHTAIAMLESLGEFPFLFPASAVYAQAGRPNEHNARAGSSVTRDLEDFVGWVNRTFRNSDGTPPIPPDPTKHLHGTRFRRTLAYFIVRRPVGSSQQPSNSNISAQRLL
jgi:integrase